MTEPDFRASMQTAAQLVAQAESLAGQRQWLAADALFGEAVAADATPASRIAYGVCLARQERYGEAIVAFMPIMDGSDRRAIGIVCHNLAAIYRDVGDADLARRFQMQAVLLQEHSSAEELLGLSNDALAGEHAEAAEALLMAACDMSVEEGELVDGDLIGAVGLIRAQTESAEDGIVTLFSAFRRHRAMQDLRGMGQDLMNMASLFGTMARYRAERTCVTRAIRYFDEATARNSAARARQHLAKLDYLDSVRTFDVRRN